METGADEHALQQLDGFPSTSKILVISGDQTLRLHRADMKIKFCCVVNDTYTHQCNLLMTWL